MAFIINPISNAVRGAAAVISEHSTALRTVALAVAGYLIYNGLETCTDTPGRLWGNTTICEPTVLGSLATAIGENPLVAAAIGGVAAAAAAGYNRFTQNEEAVDDPFSLYGGGAGAASRTAGVLETRAVVVPEMRTAEVPETQAVVVPEMRTAEVLEMRTAEVLEMRTAGVLERALPEKAARLSEVLPEREIPVVYSKFHPREARLISDPRLVERKLGSERAAARRQQAGQESKKIFLDAEAIGTCNSRFKQWKIKGKEIGLAHDQGRRRTMEDSELVVSGEAGGHTYELFGVFDGHGGEETARFLKRSLQGKIEEMLNGLREASDWEIWNGAKEACVLLDQKAKALIPDFFDMSQCGSTAVIALRLDGGDLWIFNVGDSRAILRKRDGSIEQLSEDAKPGDEKYKRSIEKRGGEVYRTDGWGREVAEEEVDFPHRIDADLSVGRSFNDRRLMGEEEGAYFHVSARPKIVKVEKREIGTGDYLLLVCDGVTDVASSQDIGDRAGRSIEQGKISWEIARDLVGAAFTAGSGDNLTALVIPL